MFEILFFQKLPRITEEYTSLITDHFRVLEGNPYLKILNLNLDSRFYSYDILALLRVFLFKERRKRLKQEPMFTLMEVVRHVFHANLEAEAQSHLVPCVFCSKNSKD